MTVSVGNVCIHVSLYTDRHNLHLFLLVSYAGYSFIDRRNYRHTCTLPPKHTPKGNNTLMCVSGRVGGECMRPRGLLVGHDCGTREKENKYVFHSFHDRPTVNLMNMEFPYLGHYLSLIVAEEETPCLTTNSTRVIMTEKTRVGKRWWSGSWDLFFSSSSPRTLSYSILFKCAGSKGRRKRM